MNNKKYDTLVLIGRFQPVHNAHVEIIRRAIKLANHLIIIIGSADQPRTFKNPFSAKERTLMLSNILESPTIQGEFTYNISAIQDSLYNDNAWCAGIQRIVAKDTRAGSKIGIIGHKKDQTSFYLDMFPQWDYVDVELLEPLNASNVRNLYFQRNANLNLIRSVVPSSVFFVLKGWKDTPEFNQVVDERVFAEKYRSQFASLPYPPIFVTADACVVCSGHVLMIKRRALPGKGLWALPGGFVNAYTDKSVRSAAIRELREETGLKVPEPVLIGRIKRHKVFDAIERSERGRIITHCYYIDLESSELPKVKGSDDAEKAKWIPLGDVKSEMCFEDHYSMIQTLTKVI